MRAFTLTFPILLLAGTSFAQQVTFERSYDYGYAEAALAVIQTADGGYLMAGFQGISIFYSKGLLIKTDAHGNEEWHNMFWAGCDTYIYDVKQLADGGYILAGDHCRMGMAADLFLARTDEFGDTLWLRSFGSSVDDRGRGVAAMPDGGFALSGAIGIPPVARLVRTDSDGNVVWDKGYLPEGATESVFESLTMADDGSFLMCGTVTFPDLERQNMLYVVKADADGNLLWERYFGGSENDQGMAVAGIPDGGVYAAGYTWSFGAGHYDMYLIRLTEEGDTLWTRTYGDERENTVSAVKVADDGGAVMVGISTVQQGWPLPPPMYHLSIVRVDPDGNEQWFRNYGGAEEWQVNPEYGYGVAVSNDGGYVACGNTNSPDPEAQAYLVKTDDEGNVVGIEEVSSEGEGAALFPNPARQMCHLKMPSMIWSPPLQLELTDMGGRVVHAQVYETVEPNIGINVGHLNAGMYMVRVHDAISTWPPLRLIVQP